MYAEGGVAYVYLCYGLHWMLNIVTGPKDYPAAILIRGLHCAERSLQINGPARLTKALKINGSFNTKQVCPGTNLWVEDRGEKVGKIKKTKRIGVDYAGEWADKPYRFTIK